MFKCCCLPSCPAQSAPCWLMHCAPASNKNRSFRGDTQRSEVSGSAHIDWTENLWSKQDLLSWKTVAADGRCTGRSWLVVNAGLKYVRDSFVHTVASMMLPNRCSCSLSKWVLHRCTLGRSQWSSLFVQRYGTAQGHRCQMGKHAADCRNVNQSCFPWTECWFHQRRPHVPSPGLRAATQTMIQP